MNKRMKKKDITKAPSNRDRMKYWKKAYISLNEEHETTTKRNGVLLEKISIISCEAVRLRRGNESLANTNVTLAQENSRLEQEIGEFQGENKMLMEKNRRQQELINSLEYKNAKHKEQLELIGRPLWKRVLGK